MLVLEQEQWPKLPKWTHAFITGTPITRLQAKEIIFRTDSSLAFPSEYVFGNDEKFAERCIDLFGWKPLLAEVDRWKSLSEVQKKQWAKTRGVSTIFSIHDGWAKKMGYVNTSFIENNWLASSYVRGPHGWCSPDGVIYSYGHNLGKWASVEEIVKDWEIIVREFPFLDVICTLYSGEYGEENSQSVCTIRADWNGVCVYSPSLGLHNKMPEDLSKDREYSFLISALTGNYAHEHGWPEEWLLEYGERSTRAMREVAPFLF